jgi:hypothetical protein
MEFAMGAGTGVRKTLTPRSVTPLSNWFEKMLSLSWRRRLGFIDGPEDAAVVYGVEHE